MSIIKLPNYGALWGYVHQKDLASLRTDLPLGYKIEVIETGDQYVLDGREWCLLRGGMRGSANNLIYRIVDELPDSDEALDNIVYMVYNTDHYDAYIKNGDTFIKMNDVTSIPDNIATIDDLDDYVAKEELVDGSIAEIQIGEGDDEDYSQTNIEPGHVQITGANDEDYTEITDNTIATEYIVPSHERLYIGRDSGDSIYIFGMIKSPLKSGQVSFSSEDLVTKKYVDDTISTELATALGDYLPLAGGTMSGDIVMQGNKVTNTGWELRADGLFSKEASTSFRHTSLQFQDNEAQGGMYANANSFLYNFAPVNGVSQQIEISSGHINVLGTGMSHISIDPHSFIWSDADFNSNYREFRLGDTILIARGPYHKFSLDDKAGVFAFDQNKFIQINNNNIRLQHNNTYMEIANSGTVGITNSYNKSITMLGDGSLVTSKATFTNNNEFVTKKYVDDNKKFTTITYIGNGTTTDFSEVQKVNLPAGTQMVVLISNADGTVETQPFSVLANITTTISKSGNTYTPHYDLIENDDSGSTPALNVYNELNMEDTVYTVVCM